MALPGSKIASTMCACTMCEGTGDQVCVNCLGEGKTHPDKFCLSEQSLSPPQSTNTG